MILTAWHDSGICLSLSTRHDHSSSTVLRKVKGSAVSIERTCPDLIDFYNVWMGGVDRADALRSHLTTMRRCKRWWHSLWHYLLDTAFINAMILYQESGFQMKDRSSFLHELISSLIGDTCSLYRRNRNKYAFYPPLPHYSNDFRKSFPERASKRGNCVVCYSNSSKEERTFFYCDSCSNVAINKFFWIHPECMREFHSDDFQLKYEAAGRKKGLNVRYVH